MILCPNFLSHCLARGEETGALSVSRLLDGVVLWSGEHAHRGAITELAWSADCQLLASGDQNGTVHVWQASTGALLHTLLHGEAVRRLRWSPQGMLASASERTIHLWPLATPTAPAA